MRRACLLLILAALCRSAGADDPPPTLTVDAGLGGCAIPRRWLPVSVEIDNPGAELAGDLRVEVETSWGAADVHRRAVVLPRASRKRFQFAVLGRAPGALAVQVRDAAGRVRADQAPGVSFTDAPRLWAIIGPAWMGLEAWSRDGSAAVRAVRLDPEQAPEDPLGYDAADCVFLAAPDPARPWTSAARAALLAWVRDGGRIVTEWKTLADGFFPDVEGHAGEWHGGMLQATAFARFLAGKAQPAREVPAFELTLPGAEPRWSDGAHTWIQSVPLGLGEIVVLGFAVDQPPLRDTPTVRALWEKLLGVALDKPGAPGAAPSRPDLDEEIAGAPALLESNALPAAPETKFLGLFLFAYPVAFAAAYYRWLVRARAPGVGRRMCFAPVWILIILAAGLALLLGHLARTPTPSLRVCHFARGSAGDATLRGRSLAALLLPGGGTVDVDLADPDGALAMVGRGVSLWRSAGRRFARADVALDHDADGVGFHGLDLGRDDLCCLRAEWRGPVPAAAAVHCFPERDGLRVRNDGERSITGLSFWDGERLLVCSDPLEPGREITIDPRRKGVQVRVPGAAPVDGADGRGVRMRQSAACPEEALARWVQDAGTTPVRGRVLFFQTHADPGVLRWRGCDIPLESSAFVELHLP